MIYALRFGITYLSETFSQEFKAVAYAEAEVRLRAVTMRLRQVEAAAVDSTAERKKANTLTASSYIRT